MSSEIRDYHKPITGFFTNNFDIYSLNIKLLQFFVDENKIEKELSREVSLIKNKINFCQTFLEQQECLERIKSLESQIDIIKSQKRKNEFEQKTLPYLIAYRSLPRIQVSILNLEEDKEDEYYQQRLDIIEGYLSVCKEFFPIEIYRKRKIPKSLCKNCQKSLPKIANSEGIIVCEHCLTEHNNSRHLVSSDTVYHSSGSNDSEENFIRAFLRYEGKESEIIPKELFDDLDKYFSKIGRPSKEEVRNMPEDMYGLRGDTDHDLLRTALAKTGWSHYYENENLIGHLYWGWRLPEVKNRDRVIELYRKSQEGFRKIPPEERERESSIGTQFHLWKLLTAIGHPCQKKHFKIAQNQESSKIHENLYRKMVELSENPDDFQIL